MDDLDARFLRSILVGAAIGIPALWILLTAVGLVAGQSLLVSAGCAGVAAFFCGPFLGGLFTTARVWHDPEAVETAGSRTDEHDEAPAIAA